jgi:hypothetical protein
VQNIKDESTVPTFDLKRRTFKNLNATGLETRKDDG